MSKDQRLYGKFTLNFPRHHKIAILSDAAFRCLVEATLYSRDELTDGLLARRYAVARWGLDALQELCQNDDEKPSLIEVEKGWLIHDYAEHQDTKEEVEERSRRNKLAGQKGGQARAKQVAKQPASEVLSEIQAVVETETEKQKTKDLPDPYGPSDVDPLAHITEKDFPPSTFGSVYSQEFEEFWDAYPRKAGKRKAFTAWKTARRRAPVHTIIEGAKRYAKDPNRTDQFTKYPEGWLNRDGWTDEPIPGARSASVDWDAL